MIRYVRIKNPNTNEIRGMVKDFCTDTGADSSQCQALLSKLPKLNVFGAINGRLQGICAYSSLGNKAIAEFLYIMPEQRGKIIGGRLYHVAMEDAKNRGAKTVVIFTRPETSKRYLKLGGYKIKFNVLEGDL